MFGHRDPVGRRIDEHRGGDAGHTVIGVAADIRPIDLRSSTTMVMYAASPVYGYPAVTVLVRSSRSRAYVQHTIQDVVAGFDSNLPFTRVETMEESVARTTAADRLLAHLMDLLAGLAAVLAMVGLYTVVAFSVSERTREIGIRMALGARAKAVVRLVVRQSARITFIGLVLGAGAAVALARVLASKLFEVTALDPRAYAAAGVIWVVLAALASVVPARAATRVDPSIAMRAE